MRRCAIFLCLLLLAWPRPTAAYRKTHRTLSGDDPRLPDPPAERGTSCPAILSTIARRLIRLSVEELKLVSYGLRASETDHEALERSEGLTRFWDAYKKKRGKPSKTHDFSPKRELGTKYSHDRVASSRGCGTLCLEKKASDNRVRP